MVYSPWGHEEWDTTERLTLSLSLSLGSQVALVVKNPSANAGNVRRQVLSLRQEGGGHKYPLQHSCLKNPMGRGAW